MAGSSVAIGVIIRLSEDLVFNAAIAACKQQIGSPIHLLAAKASVVVAIAICHFHCLPFDVFSSPHCVARFVYDCLIFKCLYLMSFTVIYCYFIRPRLSSTIVVQFSAILIEIQNNSNLSFYCHCALLLHFLVDC